MGFCLMNNVAVGAAHALARGLERVAIVDFDVHHGNGTQEIFWTDRRVLYVSSHQFPWYPGTGGLDEVGEGEGRGFTVNLPMPAGLGDADYSRAYREVVLPVGRAFDPQLVLVSAGFDAHAEDPLAGMRLTAGGFGELVEVCLEMARGAARGRVVAVLEGGYSTDGLAGAAASVAGRLLHGPSPSGPSRDRPAHPAMARLLEAWRVAQAPFWPALR
jgi:acetoin utilization deacetylase AcuC-like enzyme